MGRFTILPLAYALVLVAAACPVLGYVPHGAAPRSTGAAGHHANTRTYIVLVEPPPAQTDEDDEAAHRRWHESFLQSSGGGVRPRRIRHSYTSVLSGFAARLTDAELAAVSRKPGFVRAFPERRMPLMTTRTPGLLGLTPDGGVWNATGYGEGTIIGFLDTGIDEKHPSFRDDGMPPPPPRWKGACQPPVRCNNKLIGAASFVVDNTITDDVGHGTHTTGTAAGRFVEGVSAFGLGGGGTAAGMAPGAHMAVYKDPIAIGAFAAVSKGVLVVCAGGNSGPLPSTLSNEAPWILTVAAGSVDRSFRASVRLGDGEMFGGESLTQDKHFSSKVYPLYYSNGMNFCDYFNVNITGMVVVCDTETPVPPMSSIEAVREAGGAGVVFINEPDFGYTIVLEKYYNLPMSQVTVVDGTKIMGYAMKGASTTNHTATIVFNSTVVGVKPAPIVEAFSSRGPSVASPGVLKPDVMAPGLNILAAWPSEVPVGGPESNSFDVVSGTSMATPHITGIVALVKKAHPDWSPAAIKSAIMTTSSAIDNDGNQIMDEEHRKASFYSVGAGHVVPAKAVDPGLVYNLGVRDYAGYICRLLGEAALKTIAGNTTLTCTEVEPITGAQLNYPAILVPLRADAFAVNRTVTNVGPAKSNYTAKIEAPKGLMVKVEPAELEFTKANERKTFTVTVSAAGASSEQEIAEGALSWLSHDHDHVVRSPIVADSTLTLS
ncbi:unnamed protein product [Miscanthus lutarioriparius]|uniref:Uncharacterized protein n=1 Tax=Miscanthus lutarioriparius TaxID=422564 RepID=A0A811RRA6_9POAL|nr:unnamed protein product [Miscanthus lutarioriparius]